MKQVNVKKLILPNIPYVFIALLATKVSEAVRLAPGSDASAKLLNIMTFCQIGRASCRERV